MFADIFYMVDIIRRILLLFLLDPITVFCVLFLFFTTAGYVFILTIVAKLGYKSKFVGSGEAGIKRAQYPMVSFIVPAHNEEETIERKLMNTLELDYPKDRLEVIVVDDGSTDNTFRLLEKIRTSWLPELKIIRQRRRGKSSAENTGLQNSKGKIVVMSDADVPLNPSALYFMVEDFRDPKVGGVSCTGRADKSYVLALNFDLGLYTRKLESNIDSAFGMGGPFVAFRRAIMPKIDEGIFSSDADMALMIRKKGYRVVFDPRIVSDVNRWVEGRPKTVVGNLKKLKHMTFGSFSLFIRHNDILFKKQYGMFGWIMAPRYLLLRILAPMIFVLFSVNFGLRVIENGFLLPVLFFVVLFLSTTLVLRKVVSSSLITRVLSLILMYAVGYYAQFFYYCVFFLWPSQRRGIWERHAK